MTTNAVSSAWSVPPTVRPAGQRWIGPVSLLLGIGFTALLFTGIALYDRAKLQSEAPVFGDLGVTSVPVEPPPPPSNQTEAVPEPTPVAGFDLAPSASPVEIAASPPSLEILENQEASRMPTASLEFRLPTNFRPKVGMQVELNHVFQRNEVDAPAVLLTRTVPPVSDSVEHDNKVMYVTFIWVVEIDGTVSNARVAKTSGNPRLDALMLDMIKDSIFSPAMKNGRKVREITEQQIDIKWSGGSIFH